MDKASNDLNLEATELRLGLPGRDNNERHASSTTTRAPKNNKRSSSQMEDDNNNNDSSSPPQPKAQVVGWPPVRSFRKNALQPNNGGGMLVKVSMDGAPYLRKVDLQSYKSYGELLKGLENLFKCSFGAYSGREGYHGSDYEPTYEDKDGDLMLLGDVPWDMFLTSCRRLRLIKAAEAKGMGGS